MEKEVMEENFFEGSLEKVAAIYLDGRMQADLNWKQAGEEAQRAMDLGLGIMWDIELGLFDRLTQPLTSQGQFLSLAISLEYFRDSIWSKYQSHSLGVSLFRGNGDFSQGFVWDSHQKQNLEEWLEEIQLKNHPNLVRLFCRDVAVEYLSLLATRLPDTLPAYLFLDGLSFNGSISEEMQYFNPERFDRFSLVLKNSRLPFDDSKEATIGVCVPPMSYYSHDHYLGFEEGLNALQGIPFKLISESRLNSQWDGLDFLMYSPTGLSVEGKRKLQGFCAAGGTAISVGHLLRLPLEITLHDFLTLLRKEANI